MVNIGSRDGNGGQASLCVDERDECVGEGKHVGATIMELEVGGSRDEWRSFS